jgi:single-strand DNA-binding protein
MSLNKIIQIGNLTRDPEAKYTPQGTLLVNFGIAVNRITKTEEGDYEVDFFNCTAWQKTAEYMKEYVTKGCKVAIEGRLQQRRWVDESGNNRSIVDIVVERVDLLKRPEGAEEGEPSATPDEPAKQASASSAPKQTAKRPAPAPPTLGEDEQDDSDPFADN